MTTGGALKVTKGHQDNAFSLLFTLRNMCQSLTANNTESLFMIQVKLSTMFYVFGSERIINGSFLWCLSFTGFKGIRYVYHNQPFRIYSVRLPYRPTTIHLHRLLSQNQSCRKFMDQYHTILRLFQFVYLFT